MASDFAVLKPYFLLIYAAYGVTCLGLAGAPGQRACTSALNIIRTRTLSTVLAAFAASLLLVAFAASQSALLLDAALIAPLTILLQPGYRTRDAWTIARVVCIPSVGIIVLSLVWWRMIPTAAAPLPLATFAIVLSTVLYGLSDPKRLDTSIEPSIFIKGVPLAFFVAAGFGLMLDLSIYRPGTKALYTLAHHWGAFVGSVTHIKGGLVPFFDVPLQYGLGPSLAIAAACGGADCWTGTQAVFGATTLLSAALILIMALATRIQRGWAWTCTVTLVIFTAAFMWTGLPSDGDLIVAYPSTGGIRFLPLVIVASLLFFGRTRAATVAMVPTLLWSPESAAMACVLFGLAGTARSGFIRSALLTGCLLAGSYGALFLLHRMVYGVWIDPAALVEYVLHVPGPLPIDPFSDILLLATVLGLGGWMIFRVAPDPADARRDLVVTALLFAVSSYCLGRSHPNNVCNLAPFLALVALRALDRAPPHDETLRRATAFGIAVGVAALAFSTWQSRPYAGPMRTGIDAVVADFGTIEPDVARIRAEIPHTDGLGIADFGPARIRHPIETEVWTPMDPSSLWMYVPSERRKVYIARSARRLRRAGWAIFSDPQLFLLDDILSAYTITGRKSFEGTPAAHGDAAPRYTVACLTPKPQFAPALAGPPCPLAWTAKDAVSGE